MTDSLPQNSFNLPHLSKIWCRYTSRSAKPATGSWWIIKTTLEGLGLPLEETLQYLSKQQPTLDEFEQWILERNDGRIDRLRIERLKATIDGMPYSYEVATTIRSVDESEPNHLAQ